MNQRGASNRPLVALIVALVVALIIVLILWQRDREAKDLKVEIGKATPARVAPAA